MKTPDDPASQFPFPDTAYDVVALVSSAGGLKALSCVLSALPGDFPAALVVVQHVSPRHRSHLAPILSRRTPLRVKDAQTGDRLAPGTVFVAPPDQHLLLQPDGTLALSRAERVRHVRPSGDLLFTSLAAACKERGVAVILTGAGANGSGGIPDVKQAGGVVLAQDEASSEYFDMPRAAIATGAVDHILPLREIAPALVSLLRRGKLVARAEGHGLRVLVADADPALGRTYQKALSQLGHEVVGVGWGKPWVVEQVRVRGADLLITELPDEADTLGAAVEAAGSKGLPVLIVSARHDAETVRRVQNGHVLSYLVKPVSPANLEAAIPLVMRRFAEVQALREEVADLRQALTERKLIERARGVLMGRLRLGEQEALRRLERLASGQGRAVAEVAQALLNAEDTFRQLEARGVNGER
jgi:two-component system chemotaxis response regulator CheB